jgi:hypothetical protein
MCRLPLDLDLLHILNLLQNIHLRLSCVLNSGFGLCPQTLRLDQRVPCSIKLSDECGPSRVRVRESGVPAFEGCAQLNSSFVR